MKINRQKDYYSLLGVEKSASVEEIRVAYRKLARQYHPDVNPGDPTAEEKFKDINEANEVLSDQNSRSEYDSDDASFPPPNFWQAQPQQSTNSHVETIVTINEHEALLEIKRMVKYNRRVYCVPCDGKGGTGSCRTICPDCNGSGVQTHTLQNGVFFVQQQFACQRCCQRGYLHQQVCVACSGFGFIDLPTTKEVTLPKGCIGRQFVVPDVGNWERQELRPGHLVIRVGFNGSRDYEYLQDLSVVKNLTINPVHAMLGVQMQVTTLDGTEITCNVPKGCCEGHLEHFPNLGLPRSESERAQFIVRIMFAMPTEISPEEEKLLRDYLDLKQGGKDTRAEEKTNSTASDPEKEEKQ